MKSINDYNLTVFGLLGAIPQLRGQEEGEGVIKKSTLVDILEGG